jgi:hypothetical protein
VVPIATRRIYGVDFSSAPSQKKPITIAVAELDGGVLHLTCVHPVPTFDAFDAFLMHEGPWAAAFDLPFSLPRELIEHYGWPTTWPEFIRWYAQAPREMLRQAFKDFCDARPAGGKFAYRKADGPAGSSPAMRWTNPPVAWMAQAGASRLLAAGVHIPGLMAGQDVKGRQRVALEAYPGFTARKVTRQSYKSDTRAKQTPERRAARELILSALVSGDAALNVRLSIAKDWVDRCLDDGSGDLLDAVICALQAAHAVRLPNYGLPKDMDPLEGWIASVPARDLR